MKKLPNLPIGDSSFESIREGRQLYVDKTRHIFQMADQGKYYFISRPRRFGKSLTVSTLKCLFQGKKELFKGLWIAENAHLEWKEHPVVIIDFSELAHDTPENLKQSLESNLAKTAARYGVSINDPLLPGRFAELITELFRKAGTPVAVLVDEYDKPIISHLGKDEEAIKIAKQNREIMKYFFGVLKGTNVSPCLGFVFFTGVSKFSRVSIFSELNNLNDITMNRHYADMLGYTQKEIEICFAAYIKEFAREIGESPDQVKEMLRKQYDGYRFSEKDIRVYNPFSVLRSLNEKGFKNYWFETGTPTFLVNLLKETNWYLPEIEGMTATETVFSTYELENLKPEALLFQTGYSTIREVRGRLFVFDYPNQEVKTAFLETLFHAYTEGLRNRSRFVLLAEYLQKEDTDAFMETMTAVFASIPYALESKRDEAYFHTIFYLMVSASGINARSEVLTCKGRIDLVTEFPDKVFIIEFKCNQSAEVAIQQIRDKGYADPYKQSGKKIILMGINFDSEKRNVSEWESARIALP
ncbi:ATP-binding protein [Desulfobacterales bacterium HSG2]|nr:ATP-binding protein [Desulfobacterales bacterium HSG2]